MSDTRIVGTLNFMPVKKALELAAQPSRQVIQQYDYDVHVAPIDTALSDTVAFCESYNVSLKHSANCVIVRAVHAGNITYAAIMVIASSRIDINGAVRRALNARKISFAPLDEATKMTGMEFGGINPIGLPADWQILVDTRVAKSESLVIGSGIRGSKFLVSGSFLANLPNASILDLVKRG